MRVSAQTRGANRRLKLQAWQMGVDHPRRASHANPAVAAAAREATAKFFSEVFGLSK